MNNNYVVYHLHSEDSLLDSCTNFKDYIDYASELGQKAIGFSEHGNIYNWFRKKQYAESKGLKYLHCIECYLTEKIKLNEDEKNIRDNYHTILIAKDWQGFVEINNLFFLSSQPDHFYYTRRLTFDEFFGISDHVIKISACLQSPLNKFKKNCKNRGITENDKKILEKLLKTYDYYEIQGHIGLNDQIEFNKYLYKMSKKFNKPLIVGTDTHSLNAYKAECRTILQYGKTDGVWGDEENECDLTYKTYDELVDMFKKQGALPDDVILEAIDNTNKMADSVEEIVIDTKDKYPVLYGDKDEEVFRKIINDNYKYKLKYGIISDNKRYIENIKEEMRVFKKINMIGFMLFMSEIMTWARDNNIATGFARGSVAGSTIAYITNITDVDPVKWNTVFSRFANENRVEAGDIDTDWYEDDRQKIYDHIIERFGKDKTAYILAMTTLADKSVIDVVGKAFRVKAQRNNETTPYTLEKIKEIKSEYDKDREETIKKYPDLFYYYNGLTGCVVAQSQHPAGIIVSSHNLIDNCGGFLGADGQIILPIDMEECHDMGEIKYDILGLKSVGVIDKVYKMHNKYFPKAHEINWNDKAVYDDMAKDNTAIFQFESDFSGDCLKKFKPQSVAELSLVNACIRPSGETYRDELLSRKIHKNPSEIIDDLLAEDLGYLVYQESTIAFLQQICGFSGSEADTVRRAIGKKDEKKISEALPKILKGYCEKSDKSKEIAEKEAKEFLNIIQSSAAYQFGRNHSFSYSLLSYMMAYLRYYYPTEFCTAFLNCANNDDDVKNGTQLLLNKGCKLVNIKFRNSRSEYSCNPTKKEIYKGMSSIKHLSEQAAEDLYSLRDNLYETFIDLLIDIRELNVDSRQLDILIKLDFFSEFGEINTLLKIVEIFNNLYGKKQIKVDQLEKLGIPAYLIEKYVSKYANEYEKVKTEYDQKMKESKKVQKELKKCEPESEDFNKIDEKLTILLTEIEVDKCKLATIPTKTEKVYKNLDCVMLQIIKEMVSTTKITPVTLVEKIKYEKDLLGYVQTVVPNMKEDYFFVMDMTGYNNKTAVLYQLCDGQTLRIKARTRILPKIDDIIHITEITTDKKWGKDAQGKWYRKEETESLLTKFTIVES